MRKIVKFGLTFSGTFQDKTSRENPVVDIPYLLSWEKISGNPDEIYFHVEEDHKERIGVCPFL